MKQGTTNESNQTRNARREVPAGAGFGARAIWLVGALTLACVAACSASADDASAGPDDNGLPTAEESSIPDTDLASGKPAPAPLATIEHESGYQLQFIPLTGSDGTSGVGLAERIPEGYPFVIDKLGLGKKTPLEVFAAFTREDSAIPEELSERYGELSADLVANRGWGLDELAAMEPSPTRKATVACDDAWFQNWVNDSLPHETWRLNQNGTQTVWSNYCDYSVPALACSSCSNATRKRYEHVRYDVDAWRAYSCLRSQGSHSYTCPAGSGTLNLTVSYQYRDANNNGWNIAFWHSQGPGTTYTWSWHWAGSNWDWLHTVRSALTSGQDQVDLYTGWGP